MRCSILREFLMRKGNPPTHRADSERLWGYLVAERDKSAADPYLDLMKRSLTNWIYGSMEEIALVVRFE